MKESLTIILCLLASLAYGQGYSIPSIKREANSIEDFSPKGWFVSDSIYGDLNNDRQEDIVFILQKKDSLVVTHRDDDSEKILPRILVVALRLTDGKFMLTETNNQILIDDNFPPTYDPPFNLMEIANNLLTLKFTFDYINGNFYFYTYKFRFQENQFVLIGADSEYVTRRNMDYEKASYNFVTKKWSWTTGVHSTDRDSSTVDKKIEWFKLDIKQLRTLKSMGRPGSWEITKDKSL